MKKIILLTLVIQILLLGMFAGDVRALPVDPEIEKLFSDEPVPPRPKAYDSESEAEKLLFEQVRFTFGLGWAGNEFLGGVAKDRLGYAKSAFGINNWLGFSYTWIYGAPEKQEIAKAIDEVAKENGGGEKIKSPDLKMLVRQKLGDRTYTYFRFGSVILIYPLVVQYGWMLPLGDVARFQVGLGLPLLLNLGINFDF